MLEKLKYKNKIILFIAVFFLLTAVSFIFIYSVSRENLVASHNQRLRKNAQHIGKMLRVKAEDAEKIINLFKENRPLIERFYITGERAGGEKAPEEFVKNVMKPLGLSLFALYKNNGNEMVYIDMNNSMEKEETTGEFPNSAYSKNISGFAVKNGSLRVLALGPITYKLSLSEEDNISYIKIGANIDLKSVKKTIGSEIFISRGNDILLSTREDLSPMRFFGQELTAGKERYSTRVISLKSIYGEKTVTLIIALSQKDLMGSLKRLELAIIIVASGCVLISVILGIALIKTPTPKLKRLVELTEQLGSGRFPEETTFKGKGEVSVLGRHFLEMAKKLKDQKKALANYTTGLEDAVMRRTQELFNSREEWVRTFNSITDYVLIVDKNYQTVKANRALLNRLDLTNQELPGKRCYEIFCGKDSPPEVCPVRETFNNGTPTVREIRYDKIKGYFMVTASPLGAEEGEITGSVYVVKDITEYHNMQIQMANAEKLALIGQMAAGFAHEINNPMTSIAGCSELLLEQLDSDELRKIPQHDYFNDYLKIINREVFRCKDIIQGMLRFSRKTFKKDVVDIKLLLKEILSLLSHITKGRKIHIKENYSNKINSLDADEGEMRQMFLALIANAIDAMPEGGILTINTQASDRNLLIKIKDTGAGILPDIGNRIFEPFFTTKPVGKGTGLGLFIAFNIAKNYGGKIELGPVSNKGTTFTVTLPAPGHLTEKERES